MIEFTGFWDIYRTVKSPCTVSVETTPSVKNIQNAKIKANISVKYSFKQIFWWNVCQNKYFGKMFVETNFGKMFVETNISVKCL